MSCASGLTSGGPHEAGHAPPESGGVPELGLDGVDGALFQLHRLDLGSTRLDHES
jgi:hypothetical protein